MGVNIGATAIAGAYVGTTAVSKIYKGSTEIWSGSTPPTPTGPDYGTVVLYGYIQYSNSISNVSGGTISIDDDEGFAELFELGENAVLPYQVTIQGDVLPGDNVEINSVDVYDDNHRRYQIDSGVLKRVCTIVPDESPFTMMFTIDSIQKVVIDTSTTTTRTLVSANEFNQLASAGPQGFVLGSVPVGAVKEVVAGRLITSTPSNFLYGANNLDNLDLSYCTNLTTINNNFLSGCSSFNYPLTLPSTLTSIGNNFLYGCSSFNQSIVLPSGITSILDGFLKNTNFNYPIDLSNITSIGSSFLDSTPFNQSITLPSTLTSIGSSFLDGSNFNQPIDLSHLTSIGARFLAGTPFNQDITLPQLTRIEQYFLAGCAHFNKPIVLPNSVTWIGRGFLQYCDSFAQSVTLSSALTTVETDFLYRSDNFVGPLICNGPSSNSGISNSNNMLSTRKNTNPMYATGITLTGPYASVWKNRLPNRTSVPYRKLIVNQ